MCSGVGDWTCLQPGFPIRKSSNHSSVASSSRLIAGSYVLHRLLVPRHPPCALKNLTTDTKMLASTMQFSSYGREPPPHPAPTHHPPPRRQRHRGGPDHGGRFARGSGPQKKQHTTHPAAVPSGPNSVPSRPIHPAAFHPHPARARSTDNRMHEPAN